MGKIFAIPAPAAPAPVERLFPCLWEVQTGCEGITSEKPRDATAAEVRSYLLTLAKRRGVYVPDNATIGDAGIYVEGTGYIVPMPGYGADTAVLLEELDEAGDVVRSSRIGTNKRGGFGLDAKAVAKACALPKVTKPRQPRAVKAAAPVEAVSAPPAPVTPSEDVSALTARLEALEAIVARLSRPVVAGKRQRSEAERRAIVRAWTMRREMRERADLDRRALMAANEANAMLLEKLAIAEARGTNAEGNATQLLAQLENARRSVAGWRAEADRSEEALRGSQARALRMVRAAARHRTAAARLALDLRGSQAEARALSRRLADAPARVRAAAPCYDLTRDSGAVAALAA